MKLVSKFLYVFALALIASAGVSSARAEVVDGNYPRQFEIEARMINTTHPLNTVTMAAETMTIDVVINFNTSSDKLTPADKAQIKKVATQLKSPAFVGKKVVVAGYTDNVGKPARNQRLSYHRALRVMHALVANGVPAGMLSAQGFGKESPIASNATAEGRAANRRVSFMVVCP